MQAMTEPHLTKAEADPRINCTVPPIKRNAKLGAVRGALEAAHCTLGKKTRKFSSR